MKMIWRFELDYIITSKVNVDLIYCDFLFKGVVRWLLYSSKQNESYREINNDNFIFRHPKDQHPIDSGRCVSLTTFWNTQDP